MQEGKNKKLILLVDDNEFYHTAAKLIFKDVYEVVSVKSGVEAVEYFINAAGPVPDLIMLDIVMPDMDGWSTYNRLKTIDAVKNIPIAIVSSTSGISPEIHAHYAGVADYIIKPYTKDDLLERIKKILNKDAT